MLNVISLEFSASPLAAMVQAPGACLVCLLLMGVDWWRLAGWLASWLAGC